MTVISHPQRSLARRVARAAAGRSAALLAIAAWAVSAPIVSPAYAATVAGSVEVVTTSTQVGVPLAGGGSATPFSFRLPTGAACTGDSANDGYRVQSFIVASSVDPLTLTFDSAGPTPQAVGADLSQPMYDVFGSPFVDFNTAPATPPPGPGVIVNIPDFSYSVYPVGDIPAGEYLVGIACTKGPPSATQLDKVWTTKIDITTDAADVPAGIAFTVQQSSSTTTTTIAGTTTTTTGGSTTTTSGGTTTTTKVGTSTTVAGGTSTSAGSTTTTSNASGGALARTGGGPLPLIVWAVPLLALGRMAVLVARRPRARTGQSR